jgi:hypothetical protein
MAVPAFAGVLGWLLVSITTSIVAKVIVSLGLAVVYYQGLDLALDWAHTRFITAFTGLPAPVLQLAGVLQVGTCVNIMFAAMGVRVSLLGLNSDGFKRWVLE